MIIKFLEIRDEHTCIPVLAMNVIPDNIIQHKFLRRDGYPINGSETILMNLNDQKATVDPYEWGGRTMPAAHHFIRENFHKLNEGDVVDVRVILGEAEVSALPEIWEGR